MIRRNNDIIILINRDGSFKRVVDYELLITAITT